MGAEQQKTVILRLEPWLLEAIDRIAKLENRSRNAQLRTALSDYVARYDERFGVADEARSL